MHPQPAHASKGFFQQMPRRYAAVAFRPRDPPLSQQRRHSASSATFEISCHTSSILLARALLLRAASLAAQRDSLAFAGLHWREIGPYRGGRSVAGTGNPSRPDEFWMGTTGGGVFKSINAGQSWAPVTDKYFGGTIGAIAVAPSAPDVVYVGGGEYPIRGNVSHGDGVWKTTDGGKTWAFIGLGDTRQIADIVVHPTNPDLVYVGALGHVWAPNAERGVFRSKDGGKTWEKILFRNDSTGVVDLVMDPNNPNVLYAGLLAGWAHAVAALVGRRRAAECSRRPTAAITGPRSRGIPGCPTASGATSASPCPARTRIASGRTSKPTPAACSAPTTPARRGFARTAIAISASARWYYTKIHADPKDTNVVYDNNVSFMKSIDGGKTFRRRARHAARRLARPVDRSQELESHDRVATTAAPTVSVDGGKTWSDEDFATAQFYHVVTTTHFPYHICGAQQDNSTLCGPSRGSLDISDWLEAGGGESGWIAPRNDDPDIVYAGSYGNLLTRKDLRTGITVNVNPWPDNPMGHPAMDPKYRFQWTFPITVSKHNSNVVYAGSNVVHKTTTGGKSWTVISPDLTYHDPATLGNSGGPITKDQTSVEYYATIFVIEESPVTPKTIWTGSDDGKVFVTRDGGAKWTDVTPKDMAKFTRVSSIDASKFGECIAYVAANRFQLDDDRPYLWKTDRLRRALDANRRRHHVDRVHARRARGSRQARSARRRHGARRVVFGRRRRALAEPASQSADRARARSRHSSRATSSSRRTVAASTSWTTSRRSSRCPTRSPRSAAHLFKPRDQYRLATGGGFGGGRRSRRRTPRERHAGERADPSRPAQNPPTGVIVQYWLKSAAKTSVSISSTPPAKLIRSYTSKQDSAAARPQPRRTTASTPPPPPRVANKRGVNTFLWNMRYPDASSFPGNDSLGRERHRSARSAGHVQGAHDDSRPAGRHRVVQDPARSAHQGDARRLAGAVAARAADPRSVLRGERRREGHSPREGRAGRSPGEDAGGAAGRVLALSATFATAISEVEDSLYQTKNRSGQDPLNYPIRLNNRIGALMGVVSQLRRTSDAAVV